MNEFKTCNKCSGFDSTILVQRLKEIDNTAKVIVGCQSMCAVGVKMPFVIVNGMPIMASSIDELIERVKEVI